MVDPTAKAIEVLSTSNDPLSAGLYLVLIIVGVLAAISKPLMNIVKEHNATKVSTAKSDAEVQLYDQMKAQLQKNSEDIAALISDKNKYFEKALRLEVELEKLKILESQVIILKDLLQSKEKAVLEKETQITQLNKEIFELSSRIRALELKLMRASDQVTEPMCIECPCRTIEMFPIKDN